MYLKEKDKIMKLLRFVTVEFEPEPTGYDSWEMNIGTVTVKHITKVRWEGKEAHLIGALIEFSEKLKVNSADQILVPEETRKIAERAIETAINLLAVSLRCKRTINSLIYPQVAFYIGEEAIHQWLKDTKGIFLDFKSVISSEGPVDLSIASSQLTDRLEGVALLAEALSHDHPTGRFHELMRVFERGFARATKALINPLAEFLIKAPYGGYTASEIEAWVNDLRHPITHADLVRQTKIAFETDVRPVIGRMEQAAYDVLINKTFWGVPSTERRDIWKPNEGTSSNSTDIFITQGKEVKLAFQALDGFGAYPLRTQSLEWLPDGWWAGKN